MRATVVARAAVVLVVLTALSQVLGLVRDAIIAATFGAGAALDGYLYAQGVMNLVLGLCAAGMARAVVPPLARLELPAQLEQANRGFQTLLTLAVAATTVGAALAVLLAPQLVTLLAPGFDGETAAAAARTTRLLVGAALFVALTDICAAAAQSHGRFVLSGLQGLPFNLVMIAAALLLGPRLGVEALALGFVVGSAARFALQLPALRRVGLGLRPRLSLDEPTARESLQLLPALLLTVAVTNVNTLVDRAVGSAQGAGVITALSFGWRLVMLVDALLVLTVAAALYPAFSTASRPEQRDRLRRLVGDALRVMGLVLVPVVITLVLAREPLVELVYGRGAFDERAVEMTSTAVGWYAASALGLALRVLMVRSLLALGDRRTPVVTALLSMVVNVVGDLTLGRWYGVAGLAGSTTAALAVGVVVLAVTLHRRHRALPLRAVLTSLIRIGATGLLTAGLVRLLDLPARVAGSAAPDLFVVLLTTALVLAIQLLLLLLTRAPEPLEVWSLARRSLPGRLRRPDRR